MGIAKSYQPSLFDAPAYVPAVVLDINQGRRLRDMGIEKAVLHAEQQEPQWADKAFDLLKQFLNGQHNPFMAEDLRSYAALIDFPLPPCARAWGGVMARAAKAGLIERIGIQQVRNKKAHCANASLWHRIK